MICVYCSLLFTRVSVFKCTILCVPMVVLIGRVRASWLEMFNVKVSYDNQGNLRRSVSHYLSSVQR